MLLCRPAVAGAEAVSGLDRLEPRLGAGGAQACQVCALGAQWTLGFWREAAAPASWQGQVQQRTSWLGPAAQLLSCCDACAAQGSRALCGHVQADAVPHADINDVITVILTDHMLLLLLQVCRRVTGATVKCASGHCTAHFHPLCGRARGFYLALRPGSMPGSTSYRAFCGAHSDRERAKDREAAERAAAALAGVSGAGAAGDRREPHARGFRKTARSACTWLPSFCWHVWLIVYVRCC